MYLSSRGDRAGVSKEIYGNLLFSMGGGPDPPPPSGSTHEDVHKSFCIEYNAYSGPLLFAIFIVRALRPR